MLNLKLKNVRVKSTRNLKQGPRVFINYTDFRYLQGHAPNYYETVL